MSQLNAKGFAGTATASTTSTGNFTIPQNQGVPKYFQVVVGDNTHANLDGILLDVSIDGSNHLEQFPFLALSSAYNCEPLKFKINPVASDGQGATVSWKAVSDYGTNVLFTIIIHFE